MQKKIARKQRKETKLKVGTPQEEAGKPTGTQC